MAEEAKDKGQQDFTALLQEADQKFIEGDASLKKNELDNAVACFQRALEIRVEHYGETAIECASAYYKYGSAVLLKAVEETGVFGAEVPASAIGEDDDQEDDQETPQAEAAVGSVANDGDELASGEEDNNGDEQEDEEATDMQIAWENLEMAKVIYLGSSGYQLELANVHEKLADISMEQEQFEQAVLDYKTSIQLLEDALEPDNRIIICLLFQTSLALQMQASSSEALATCSKAVDLCQGRIRRLRGGSTSSSGSPTEAALEEAKDLEGVLEDLNEKVEELKLVVKQEEEQTKIAKAAITAMFKEASTVVSAFDSPQLAASGTSTSANPTPVDLGVVGRGKGRVTAVPAVTSSNNAEAASNSKPAPMNTKPVTDIKPKKRVMAEMVAPSAEKDSPAKPPLKRNRLEALMGGNDGQEVSTGGFDAPKLASKKGVEALFADICNQAAPTPGTAAMPDTVAKVVPEAVEPAVAGVPVVSEAAEGDPNKCPTS